MVNEAVIVILNISVIVLVAILALVVIVGIFTIFSIFVILDHSDKRWGGHCRRFNHFG